MAKKFRIKRKKNFNFISMDLGTTNTLVYVSGQGIIYNEPSVVAYDVNNNNIIAVGIEAFKMVGKGNKRIKVIAPMVSGVISDIRATEAQLKFIFSQKNLVSALKNSIVLLACPSQITNLEKRVLKRIAFDLGAAYVFVEEEVKMAAIGGGINIHTPTGNLIVDIGGGTSDIAVIASGDIVLSKSLKIAGVFLNREIQKYIRSHYGLGIGIRTAEKIKIDIGTLIKPKDKIFTTAYGRDVVSGLPRSEEISSEEILEIIKTPIAKIIDLIVQVLEATPNELSGDIYQNGITICGGGGLIRGIAEYFSDTLSLPVRIGEEPLLAVINGTKKYEHEIAAIITKEKNKNNILKRLN